MGTSERPTRLSFVCSGNICRSPTAEVVMRALIEQAGLAQQITVESHGTGGWHVGEDMDRRTAATLRENGYDADGHRARQFSAYCFADLDLVVALDEGHLAELRAIAGPDIAKVVLLGDFADSLGGPVPDPYYGGPTGFADVLTRVEDGCRGLLAHLRTTLTP